MNASGTRRGRSLGGGLVSLTVLGQGVRGRGGAAGVLAVAGGAGSSMALKEKAPRLEAGGQAGGVSGRGTRLRQVWTGRRRLGRRRLGRRRARPAGRRPARRAAARRGPAAAAGPAPAAAAGPAPAAAAGPAPAAA